MYIYIYHTDTLSTYAYICKYIATGCRQGLAEQRNFCPICRTEWPASGICKLGKPQQEMDGADCPEHSPHLISFGRFLKYGDPKMEGL